MKKIRKILTAMMCAAAFTVAGCTPEPEPAPGPEEPVAVESVTLDAESIELVIGETRQLTASILPENADTKTATWESADPAIAAVDENGLVTAIAAGSTTITASADDKTASCTVTVNEPGPDGKIDMTGMTAEEVRAAIDEALEAGVTEFSLSGEFEKLGMSTTASPMDSSWTTNPFIGTNVEVIDLSGVTGWPEVDADGLMDGNWQTAPDGVYGLPAFAFSGQLDGEYTLPELREIILPEEVEALGSQSMWSNPKLEKVVCPGVKIVGNQCLVYCPSLASIDLPEATTIHTYAFRGTGLTSISLPKVVEFSYGLFNECPLTKVEFTAAGNFTVHEHPLASIGFGEPVFNFSTSACELVLNADKHYETGNATPQATSATNWCDTEWKSISFN